ncbi:MAG: esterase [Verrucomicrobia bacterium]|nr:esterase [Verrucomicrobiota bacterium]
MNRKDGHLRNIGTALVAAWILTASTWAQPAAPAPAPPGPRPGPRRGSQGPLVISPEVHSDRRVTFRVLAPRAENVRLAGGDIPGNGRGAEMSKGTNGVWEVTLGPIDPGAYRYNFIVDGLAVVDPRSPAVSESNNNVWSLVYVPGAAFMDTLDVPHGAVAAVTYYSTALRRFRRMHIYTPPGYESGRGRFPVFYLLHGAGDCDDSWTSVGRAGFILDNLIAAGKAKPMVVVMPAGHTRPFGFGLRGGGREAGGAGRPPVDEFAQDFLTDIVPYVEQHYRVRTDRADRAIAGLSMGGSQSLNVALPHLDRFAYVGVFSSGLIGAFGGGRGPGAAGGGPTWEEQHQAALDNAQWKHGLKLIWFSTGKDDFLLNTTRSTVELLRRHGFDPVFHESPGAHTWINWRNYLNEFAPQLFR